MGYHCGTIKASNKSGSRCARLKPKMTVGDDQILPEITPALKIAKIIEMLSSKKAPTSDINTARAFVSCDTSPLQSDQHTVRFHTAHEATMQTPTNRVHATPQHWPSCSCWETPPPKTPLLPRTHP